MEQAVESGMCNSIAAAVHVDPSVDRKEKTAPELSVYERVYLVRAIKYVSEVYEYQTEQQLRELIIEIRPCIRILGEDYIGKPYTGREFLIPVFYAERRHEWSGTLFRKRFQQ